MGIIKFLNHVIRKIFKIGIAVKENDNIIKDI